MGILYGKKIYSTQCPCLRAAAK
nr:hypothetical protein [Niabella ginsengisoli]